MDVARESSTSAHEIVVLRLITCHALIYTGSPRRGKRSRALLFDTIPDASELASLSLLLRLATHSLRGLQALTERLMLFYPIH